MYSNKLTGISFITYEIVLWEEIEMEESNILWWFLSLHSLQCGK